MGACALTAASLAHAEPIVTIVRVELKDDSGRWFKIMEPDRRFDTAREEPRVSFFNDGRVFPGRYVNFRLTALGLDPRNQEPWIMTGKTDLAEPFAVKNSSFIGVKFQLDPARPPEVRELVVTVDDQTRRFGPEQLLRSALPR